MLVANYIATPHGFYSGRSLADFHYGQPKYYPQCTRLSIIGKKWIFTYHSEAYTYFNADYPLQMRISTIMQFCAFIHMYRIKELKLI